MRSSSKKSVLIRSVICMVLLGISAITANAQQVRELEDVLTDYESSQKVKFFYKKEWLKDIHVDDAKLSLKDFLANTLPQHKLTYSIYQERYIILFPVAQQANAETR